jgi:N-acetylneuraminate synthase
MNIFHSGTQIKSSTYDYDMIQSTNTTLSANNTAFGLIKLIKGFKKPIIISTGACTIDEINNLDNYLGYNSIEIAFLHCVLSYPTKNHDANLQFINILKKRFPKRIVGYSDHTMPDKNMLVLTEAYKSGAQIIEKHFTLDTFKGKKNNDHFHSMDYKDLQKFFGNLKFVESLYNKNNLIRNVLNCEKKSRKNARRSIFTRGIIENKQKIKMENLIAKRPGTGISPLLINKIINKITKKKLKDDHKIKWSDLK